jgi:hypothetical protein
MTGIMGFKVALCFAYLRITGGNLKAEKSRYRLFIWGMMAFSIISHLAGTLALVFQCSPVRKSWRPLTPGTCLPKVAFFYALAVITIFCDVVIFLMPIPLLLKIQINIRKKVGLVAVFALGLFTTVCSIMRMIQIQVISANGNSTMLVLWGTIEMNVGVSLSSPTNTLLLASQLTSSLDLPHMSPMSHATLHLLLEQAAITAIRQVQQIWW